MERSTWSNKVRCGHNSVMSVEESNAHRYALIQCIFAFEQFFINENRHHAKQSVFLKQCSFNTLLCYNPIPDSL